MNDAAATGRILALAVHALPTLLWAIIALEFWRLRIRHRPRSTLYLLLPIATTLFTFHMMLHLIAELVPAASIGFTLEPHGAVGLATTAFMIAIAPIVRHIVLLLPGRADGASRSWLRLNYGSAVAVGLGYAALLAIAHVRGREPVAADVVANAYVLLVLGSTVLRGRRSVTRGSWLQGIGVTELRSADMAFFALALGGTAVMLFSLWTLGSATLTGALALLLHTVVAIAFAVPFAVRMLGRVVRNFVVWAPLLAASGFLFFAVPALARTSIGEPAARLVDLGAYALLLAVFFPGRAWLESAVDRFLFRRGQERHADLQQVADSLSPRDGLESCIRRALAELCRVMQFAGGGVLLTRGRGAFAHGEIDLAALEASWPTDAVGAVIPSRPLMELELRELPADLQAALVGAQVVRLAPIGSPRQRWGYLFATEPLLASPISEADLDALEAFLNQLALVLDGCELLERAIAVERSLAHAEKLAAIGELAARIAHEIRNPITAARSLAQQLVAARGDDADREAAALILSELERVERQVAELLRFARRDELHLEPVDLGELARTTLGSFQPRLEGARVSAHLDCDDGVVASADRERLRQVLINLIENSLDALAAFDGERSLDVAVERRNGNAHLRVHDSGPGVEAEALPRIFEPFFSLKAHGTGLGLAIVKRTIEAHGGQIRAEVDSGHGMSFAIELPLAEHR